MRPVWIEAALNGPWGRERQPGIPVTVEEIVADGIACAAAGAGFIYQNSLSDIRDGVRLCREHRLHPGFAIYEPGFTRLGAALAAMPGTPSPIYRFMFSDEFAWGFPPDPAYLDAHLRLLAECHGGAPWMVAGLGVDIRKLIAPAVERGGHVRVGLEDAPWRTELSNRQWVEGAAARLHAAGAEPASAPQVRAALARKD